MTRSDLRATAKQLAIREKQVTDLQAQLAAAEARANAAEEKLQAILAEKREVISTLAVQRDQAESRLAAAEEALEMAYGLLPAKDSAYYLLSPEVRATVGAVELVREERAKLAKGKER